MRGLPFGLLLLSASALASPTVGTGGMVSAAHPAATEAGVQMLRAGGNAVDAAAAAAFTLAVVEPYSSGVGGGGFALVKFNDTLDFVDFREVAPRAATAEMYVRDGKPDPEMSRDGVLSAAVPGAVAGYLELHRRFGKLPRAQMLAPAIKAAAEGFPVNPTYRKYAEWRLELLRRDPEATRILLVNNEIPDLGHILVQADLARTLRALAQEGPDAFYKGSVAERLAADMKARGGIVTREDLRAYKVRTRAPLVGSYRGHAVVSSPPPSSGGQILLTILNVMETLPPDTPFRSPKSVHVYVEASKRAFADRILLGDPDFVGYVGALIPQLITKDRAAVVAQVIGERATPASEIAPGQGAQLPLSVPRINARALAAGSGNTSHLCTVDKDGNAVSMTTTINYGFGSGVIARGTGVIWNDEMDDFSVGVGVANAYGIVGSEANAVAPGKVPLSSMSPTMVFSGPTTDTPLRLVIGSPGGSRIPTTVAQGIINHIEYGMNIERAIAAGRVHHQHLPDRVFYEPFALEPATVVDLTGRGHALEAGERTWSNATAIAIDPTTNVRSGAADPRHLGTAVAE